MSDFQPLLKDQLHNLLRYAAALTRNADQAVDLVEDTVREALSRQHNRPGGDLRVWLLTILHDQRGNPFRQADPAADPSLSDPDPAALLTLSDFDRALGQLPEEQRAVILLVGLEGLSYDRTAAILRVSSGTARARLARGRESLRRELGATDSFRLVRAA